MAMGMVWSDYAPEQEQGRTQKRVPLLDSLVWFLTGLAQCWGPPATPPKPAGVRVSDRQWRRQSAFIMARYGESP